MTRDVFISYTTDDKAPDRDIAEAVCKALEKEHIFCWIAPRNVPLGEYWVDAAVDAIDNECNIFVLILSANSNKSPAVLNEIERAASRGIPFIPIRIDDLPISKAIQFHMSRYQWLDAWTLPIQSYLPTIVLRVRQLLDRQKANHVKKETEDIAEKQTVREIEEVSIKPEVKKENTNRPVTVHKQIEEEKKISATPVAKAVPSVRTIAKPGWFWTGVELMAIGLLFELICVSMPVLKDWRPEQFPDWSEMYTHLYGELYPLMAFTLIVLFFGGFAVIRGLAKSLLTRKTWFGIGTVLVCAGAGFPFVMVGFLFSALAGPDWNIMLPIVSGVTLPFLIAGFFCFRWGLKLGGDFTSLEAIHPTELTPKSAWFWFGIVFFIIGQAGGSALLLEYLVGTESYILAFVFGCGLPIMTIPLILTSRRKIRHIWFWPGAVLLSFGLGSIPEWLNMYLNMESYTVGPVPRDVSDLQVCIGVGIAFVIAGIFSLFKGWPRLGIKHPVIEVLSFGFSALIVCTIWCLVLWSNAV